LPSDAAPLDRAAVTVLLQLAEAGAMRPGELAARLEVEAPHITRQVQRLAQAGYAERAPDPDDRRAQLIALTPADRAAARRIRETGRNGMQAALAHWSPQDSLPGPDQALPEPPADEGLVRAGLLEREGGRLLFRHPCCRRRPIRLVAAFCSGPRGVLGDELIRGHGRRGVCGSGRQWEAMFGPSLAMT